MFNICPKARINLAAIRDNYLAMRGGVSKETAVSCVVKNDAYGLGAQKVAQTLYEAGCRDYWVAYFKEAIDIRRVLPFDAKIYFLQGFHGSYTNLLKTYQITPVINSEDELRNVVGSNLPIVLHFDTGLSRLGLRFHEWILDAIKNEKIEYVISHLACSDNKEHPLNIAQKDKFDSILKEIRMQMGNVRAGLSASSGALLGKDFHYDIVRVGAFLYGISNSKEDEIKPRNVLSLRTNVLQTYEIDEGTCVGYGSTFCASRKTKLAIVSIGYADGIKRSLSNRGVILFYDDAGILYKANIVGNISMDLIACDITDIPEMIINTAHILSDDYTINEMADDAGTIAYEILTSINFKSKRFAIEYLKQTF